MVFMNKHEDIIVIYYTTVAFYMFKVDLLSKLKVSFFVTFEKC